MSRKWYKVHVELSCAEDVFVAATDEAEAITVGEQLVRDNVAIGCVNLIAETVLFPDEEVQHAEID